MDKTLQYERVLAQFDADGDGKVSPSELRRCVGGIGCEMTEEEAEAVVVLMDSDGDGLLGVVDFVRLMEEGDEEEEEEKKLREMREAFRMYEDDGDHREIITAKSLRRMLSKLGESRTVDQCRFMIERFDVDGDGVLNFDEFKIMMM